MCSKVFQKYNPYCLLELDCIFLLCINLSPSLLIELCKGKAKFIVVSILMAFADKNRYKEYIELILKKEQLYIEMMKRDSWCV